MNPYFFILRERSLQKAGIIGGIAIQNSVKNEVQIVSLKLD